MKKVIIENKKRIFDDFFKIDEAHLRYEKFDGQMSPVIRRLNFERGDSVAALIFNTSTQKITLVNQFKYPAFEKGQGWITEVMAGMIDEDESPESALRREVLEEMGYSLRRLEHISTFYVSPGGTSERIILYYAEVDDESKTAPGGGLAAEHEDIINVEMTLEEALMQVESGDIADAKTIIGILWLHKRLTQSETQP
jgi:nudix-type nucleoside diphosphatase (YffH/AdpP family)